MRVGILGVSLVWSLPVEAERFLELPLRKYLWAKKDFELKDVIKILIVLEIVSADQKCFGTKTIFAALNCHYDFPYPWNRFCWSKHHEFSRCLCVTTACFEL